MTLALTAMWSPSFLFIKLAVEDLPPITVAASRIALATVILFMILRWKGYTMPKTWSFWGHAAIVGIFSTAFPFCLFCYAEQTIDSSLAAILNGTTPMFTALIAHLVIPSDRLNLTKTVGILCCALGLVTLFAPNLLAGVTGTTEGMLAATTAAFCYSIHHIYGKKFFTGHKPFVAPTSSLAISALLLWPFALYFERPFELPMPSLSAIGGICGLAVFGTTLAFIIYYKLLEESGPTAISLVACFFPVGGILLGVLFMNETFTILHLVAAAMILFGMGIVNGVIKMKFLERKPSLEQAS